MPIRRTYGLSEKRILLGKTYWKREAPRITKKPTRANRAHSLGIIPIRAYAEGRAIFGEEFPRRGVNQRFAGLNDRGGAGMEIMSNTGWQGRTLGEGDRSHLTSFIKRRRHRKLLRRRKRDDLRGLQKKGSDHSPGRGSNVRQHSSPGAGSVSDKTKERMTRPTIRPYHDMVKRQLCLQGGRGGLPSKCTVRRLPGITLGSSGERNFAAVDAGERLEKSVRDG